MVDLTQRTAQQKDQQNLDQQQKKYGLNKEQIESLKKEQAQEEIKREADKVENELRASSIKDIFKIDQEDLLDLIDDQQHNGSSLRDSSFDSKHEEIKVPSKKDIFGQD